MWVGKNPSSRRHVDARDTALIDNYILPSTSHFSPPNRHNPKHSSTKMNNAIYCPQVGCRSFIPPRQIQGQIGTCERCNTRLCVFCHLHEHLPNSKCGGLVLVDSAATIKLQAKFEAAMAELDENERKTKKFISQLITRNANAVAQIPWFLPKNIADKYKSDLRARNFVLEDASRALFGDMLAARHELMRGHAAKLALIR